jgi:signal transduction histidine kinase
VSREYGGAELQKLRASVRNQLIIATTVALALLAVALLYVLHLIRKNRVLEQKRLAAERRSYVGLLASGLAHEIRNPLNAMNINLQMLEEELPPDAPGFVAAEYLELLAATKSEIRRLETLANNFLQYARPGSLRFESKDLNGVLQGVVMFLQADFRQKGVRLVADLEPLLPSVEIDETQFKQAVINLLVNARQIVEDATRRRVLDPESAEVRLVSRAGSSGEVVVEVRDNGPGVPAESRERIFEVFYSSRGGGTGLGLPIARQIVERHGGTIELATDVEVGATFRIRLPRRHAPAAAPHERVKATP